MEYEDNLNLQEHEMKEVLEEIGLEKVKKHTGRKGINFMFCC